MSTRRPGCPTSGRLQVGSEGSSKARLIRRVKWLPCHGVSCHHAHQATTGRAEERTGWGRRGQRPGGLLSGWMGAAREPERHARSLGWCVHSSWGSSWRGARFRSGTEGGNLLPRVNPPRKDGASETDCTWRSRNGGSGTCSSIAAGRPRTADSGGVPRAIAPLAPGPRSWSCGPMLGGETPDTGRRRQGWGTLDQGPMATGEMPWDAFPGTATLLMRTRRHRASAAVPGDAEPGGTSCMIR